MENKILRKERENIFELFIKKHKLKFSEIEREIKIRSNNLNYHLKKMINENLLEKKEDYYYLTIEAEKIMPFFAHLTGKEQGPLTIITAAIINKERICLLKRDKRPYKGYWGLIGGKVMMNESIKECALREVKEETYLDCKFDKLVAVLNERVMENGEIKHAFNIFFCKVIAKNKEVNCSDEGELKWFSLKKLPSNIIPSDKLMIKELMHKKFCFKEIVIEEKDAELIKMRVEDE